MVGMEEQVVRLEEATAEVWKERTFRTLGVCAFELAKTFPYILRIEQSNPEE
jgi:hypothetical protein